MSAAPATNIFATTLGELAQAKIRCWMNLALVTLALVAYRKDASLSFATVWYTFLFTALSAVTLLVWARAISGFAPDATARVAQRVSSILLDNISISWILYVGGEMLAGVFCIYLWISIEYGLRYGLRYLFANIAASMLGFAIVARFSPFWREYSLLAFGLGAGLIVISLCTAHLVMQLHAAVQGAESASRAKSDFLAKMSHELRTPLHGIIALAELLGGAHSTQQKQEMLRQLAVSSTTLLDLVNCILDISKYESGTFKLQPEPMNLHGVVDDVISMLRAQARAKNLHLSMFFDAAAENHLIGSPRQLQEILINVAGNALKFTERGAVSIDVLSTGEETGRSSIQIVVSDTGPGIPREQLQRIFDPFAQGDDSIMRVHEGSGLGMTIARDLVKLMGGEIAIDSEVGVGSTVTIDLVLPHAPKQPPPRLSHLRIGLVGQPPLALKDGLASLGLHNIVDAPESLPRSADCVFIAVDAENLIEELDDTSPPALGVGAVSGPDASVMYRSLLSYVDESCNVVQIRRALELVMLVRSHAEVTHDEAPFDKGHAVLIAEDNSTNQTITRIALERAGYHCTIVEDGIKALEELSSGAYDVALVDMHMPRMDGIEVARLYNFANFEALIRTPIVMLTADNRPESVADADLAGIARFVVKPIKPSSLLRVIHDVLVDREAGESLEGEMPAVVSMSLREAEPPDLDLAVFGELMSVIELGEARRLFAEFREDTLGYIGTLRRFGVARVGVAKVRNDMHALSGAACIIGASRLAAVAHRVEYGQEADLRNRTPMWIGELEDAARAAMRRIGQQLNVAA